MSRPSSLAILASLTLILAAAGCGHPSAASVPAAPDSGSSALQPSAAAPDASEASDPQPQPSPVRQVSATGSEASQPGAKPRPQRPPADRLPARPGEAEKITFDDLNLGMAADMVYRPFLLTDRVKELEGKRVSIIGYMHPAVETRKNVKEFIVLKNTECKFGPGGQADHLAEVLLGPGDTTVYMTRPLKVEATLKIEPYQGVDGNTWSIYRLEDAKVEIVR